MHAHSYHNLCGSGLCVRGGPVNFSGDLLQVSGYVVQFNRLNKTNNLTSYYLFFFFKIEKKRKNQMFLFYLVEESISFQRQMFRQCF